MARRVLLVAAILGVSGRARATVPDAFGVGARWSGAGGAGVAVVEDGAAALMNPAGLSRVRRPTAALGWTGVYPQLREIPSVWWDTNRDGEITADDPPLDWNAGVDPINGFQVQAARPLGGKFGIGLTLFVPTSTLIRLRTFEPDLPTYVLWDNRLERFSAAAGVGGEILPGLSIGVSADLLARARLKVAMTADISANIADDATNGGDLVTDAVIDVHEIELDIVPAVAPVFGLQWDVGRAIPKLEGLVVGAAYHPALGLPIDVDLDLQANVAAADIGDFEPFVGSAVADVTLALFDHYVPRKLTLGLGYRRADVFTLYGEARFTDWRRMTMSIARVEEAALSATFFDIPDDVIRDGNDYGITLRSVWSAHVGTELVLPQTTLPGKLRYIQPTVRGGFSYIPTPLVAQADTSSFLDVDRSQFTLGGGIEHWDPFALVDGPVRYDLFFQANLLANATLQRSSDLPRSGYPVDPSQGVPMGGTIYVLGGQWGFDY